MDAVLTIAGVMLVVAASLTLVRIVRGPGPADRVVATDVLITTVTGSLAVVAAVNHDSASLVVMVVLSLLAFAGTVSMARFVAGRHRVLGAEPTATRLPTRDEPVGGQADDGPRDDEGEGRS